MVTHLVLWMCIGGVEEYLVYPDILQCRIELHAGVVPHVACVQEYLAVLHTLTAPVILLLTAILIIALHMTRGLTVADRH